MDNNSKIYIAGHTGLWGSSTILRLKELGYKNIIYSTHRDLDLTSQKDTEYFFYKNKPDYVFVMAGKVGGIKANSENMADFCMENLQIATNVINAAHKASVNKLIYLSSSCAYPVNSIQPIKEECLLTGSLEPTNEGYAIAKIAGLKLCTYFKKQYGDNFISCIPANVYGPRDNFKDDSNHVIPALIKRFHTAKTNDCKEVSIWGSGKVQREFIYIEDAVDACIFLMENYDAKKSINIGSGCCVSINDLAFMIKDAVSYTGNVVFDTSKPDGMPVRMLDSTNLNAMGWVSKTKLYDGIRMTYEWFLDNKEDFKC